MFNKLPKYVCIVSSCSVDKCKSQLDKHLRNIVDLPCQSGWWRLFEWRSLCRRPGCQFDATEQLQVSNPTEVTVLRARWTEKLAGEPQAGRCPITALNGIL